MNKLRPFLPLLLGLAMSTFIPGCTLLGGPSLPGTGDSAARDRILHVTEDPPSFGFKRLTQHAAASAALKEFLEARGHPDFIIEDTGLVSRKLVLYYVKPDQAYLLSIKKGLTAQKFDVSGPEPIGKRTRELFDALTKLEQAEANLANAEVLTKKAEH